MRYIVVYTLYPKTIIIILMHLTRYKDVEIGEAEEKHQQEFGVYQQKMKHLMYTQENTLAQLQVRQCV